MSRPHEVLTASEIKAIVDRLAANFGPVEPEVAMVFGDLVGKIVIDRVTGCRSYLGSELGWCPNPREGESMYCKHHLEEIEAWMEAQLAAKEQGQ